MRNLKANSNVNFSALQGKFHSFHPVATILSYLTKAPLVSALFHLYGYFLGLDYNFLN